MKKLLALGAVAAVSTTVAYSAEASSYTVEAGDSLWVLAEDHDVSIEDIKKDNNLKTDVIVPGQVLEIGEDKEETEKEDKEEKTEKQIHTKLNLETHFQILQQNLKFLS